MSSDARPRTIGEVLDRAIAAYVSRFLPLFVILAIVGVPVAIVQTFASPGVTHSIDVLQQMLKLPAGDVSGRARMFGQLQRGGGSSGWVFLVYLLQFLFVPLANTALIVFIAQTADGLTATVGGAYRSALTRWMPQLGVALGFVGIALVGAGAVFAATLVIVLAISGVALLARPAAVILGIVAGLAFAAAVVATIALGNVAWLMSSISVALEDPNPVRAIGRGLRRTLDRTLWKRTLSAGLAIVAVNWFGTLAVLAAGGLVAFLVHVELIYELIATCGGVVLGGVCTAFAFFYTRDVQLRREGSDLLRAAGELPLPE